MGNTHQCIAGGALIWDCITLTSGCRGLLYNRLLPILNQEYIILVDENETIHLANVRGGLKLWILYEALKVL